MADKEVRLIDAEQLTINIARIAKNCARSDAQKALIGRILFMIENMPTIKAEPVKHGRWALCDDGYVRCSECNCKAFIENDETIMTDFCHGCGADMRMDGDNNE